MNKTLLHSFLLLGMVGCSTPATKPMPENTEDKIVSRIDNLEERPDWLKESRPFWVEDGKVISLGSTTIPVDHRLNAAYRVAQNNAKASISNAIEQRLEFVFQNSEEGTDMDTTHARYIGAEASKLVTSSVRLGNRYWEKVAATIDSGERLTQYKVFVTVEMPETAFKRAVLAAIKKGKAKREISSDFSKKVDAHWDKFTKGGE